MDFNDTTNKTGLLQDCEMTVFGNYGDITGNTSRLQQFTARINRACDQITSWILESDYRWQWDDTNNTTLPIGTRSLVADQQDYSFETEHIRVTRVELKDETGAWKLLQPIDQADVYNQSLTDLLSASGLPQYYDKIANSIFLYPKPSYSQASSLKVYFQRNHTYFTTSDTTKKPGFASTFHRLASLLASLDYAIAKNLKIQNSLRLEVSNMKESLQDFLAMRGKDDKVRLQARIYNFR